MKKTILSICLLAVLAPAAAQAEPKLMGRWWWSSHWKDQDFKPYFQDGQLPHNTQWDNEDWAPQDWVYLNGADDPRDLIQKWYRVDIIRKRYVDDGVPYLDIGPNFYHLSGYDKTRVMATVDHIYQVTSATPGMFYLKDGLTEKVIGYYTAGGGLTLQ